MFFEMDGVGTNEETDYAICLDCLDYATKIWYKTEFILSKKFNEIVIVVTKEVPCR